MSSVRRRELGRGPVLAVDRWLDRQRSGRPAMSDGRARRVRAPGPEAPRRGEAGAGTDRDSASPDALRAQCTRSDVMSSWKTTAQFALFSFVSPLAPMMAVL